MNRLLVLCISLVTSLNIGWTQASKIDFQIDNYENDTLIIGNYYGDKQLVKDTLIRADRNDKFVFASDTLVDAGVYLALMLPDYEYIQFIVPSDDQQFSASMDYEELAKIKFSGSKENETFYDYLAFLREHKPKAEELQQKIEAARAEGKSTEKEEAKFDEIDKKVKDYQLKIVEENKGSIASMLISANFDVDIPEFEGDEDEVKMKRFKYYRDNYFHNLDTTNIALIRTPFLHDRLMYYLDNLNSPLPDSITIAVDKILSMLQPNEDAFKFYTSFFLNKYAKMKRVGDDAIYVHIADKYYSTGKAKWVKPETLAKIRDNATKLRPLLIGNKIPDIFVYDKDSTEIRLREVDADYTVLVFWAPSCGHCTKAMPHIVKFNDKYKDQGIKTISICTKGGEKFKGCWDVLEEKDMLRLINTGDEYIRFQRQVYVRQTPKIVVLDKDKEIVIKDIPAEKLDEILQEIIKQEEMEKSVIEE